MSKVLVTGGAGFIGSHIAEHYATNGADVVVLDNMRTGRWDRIAGLPVRFVLGSVTDLHLLQRLMTGVDYVFHLAALVSVEESMEKPMECIDINLRGTLNVLEAARQAGVRKVVLSSSAAVYGNDPKVPKVETMAAAPISPYGISKLDGELYMDLYRTRYGLQTASLRYFNVFGPRQDPSSHYAAAVPIFIENALSGRDLVIFGDGRQTRDFVYVQDVVAANVLAATSDMEGVYNVARGGRVTILDLARNILCLTGSASRIRHSDARPGDIQHSTADIHRLCRAGFVPTTDLRSGLKATIEYFRTVPTLAVETCFVCPGSQPIYKTLDRSVNLFATGHTFPACG